MQGPVQHSFNHLWGALRLFRLETGGFAWVDTSNAGVVKSFRAMALSFPFWLMLTREGIAGRSVDFNVPAVYCLLTLAYVINWLLNPVVMWELARLFDRAHLWRRYVVVANWAGFWVVVLPLPLQFLFWGRPAGDPQAASLELLIILLSQIFAGYLLVKALKFRVLTAVSLTICLFMIGLAYGAGLQVLINRFILF